MRIEELPADAKERHEAFVDLFGQFIFWLRNWSLEASRRLVHSEDARERIGNIRRRYYEGVAQMADEQREAALLLAEETLNGFLERLTWVLGDEGVDTKLGDRHAYRFRVEIEIVDADSAAVIETDSINRGGRFFGKYWGRWLNRHRGM